MKTDFYEEYDKLDDEQKYERYYDDLVDELREQFRSGDESEAIDRAKDQGINMEEIE